MEEKIAVLLSGGVDSSLVVHLLCEQGHKPSLFYILIGNGDETLECSSEEDIELCRFIAHKYKLPFEIIDLHKEYWDRVVAYIIEKSKEGVTPNPDVMCNKLIKFGCFEERVGYQFDKIATGHYATTYFENDKYWLGTAKDKVKDQTDFLCQLSYKQLSKVIFPIGRLSKDEVRDLAKSVALPTAYRRDSQGICFLGKVSYNDLVKRYLGEKEGAIIDLTTGKQIGTHKGYWFHTIGQRKGLGLSQGPWFVVDKDIEKNIVYIVHADKIENYRSSEFAIRDLHFITENPGFSSEPTPITFKIRHSPEFHNGTIYLNDEGKWIVKSEQPLQRIAPGQFGVIYDRESRICYGSGEITLTAELVI